MKNYKLDVVKFDNEDVIATSLCQWDSLKSEYELDTFNTPDGFDNGKSFKYNGEAGDIGPAEWQVFASDIVFDTNGEIVGIVESNFDTSLLKTGSYYHAGYNDDEIWVECNDPSHFAD